MRKKPIKGKFKRKQEELGVIRFLWFERLPSISLPLSGWCFIYIQGQEQEKIISNTAIM